MSNCTRPNILIIMTEHQQGATVDPGSLCRMPNVVGRIAGQGVRFERSYTPCPLCAPARASFFSGRYPTGHGMVNNYHSAPVINNDLYPDVKLFSESLAEVGYSLSYVGKWHVSGARTPADFGWRRPESDAMTVTEKPAPDLVARRDEIQRMRYGHRRRQPVEGRSARVRRPGWRDYTLYGTAPGSLEDQVDYRRTQTAISEIWHLSERSEPWAIYVGLTQSHDPYFPVEPYASMYDPAEIPFPGNFHDSLEGKPAVLHRIREEIWSQLSEEQVREAIAHYWGLLSMTDDLVGRMLDALDESGVTEDTIVLYCSDHGDLVGAHGLFHKGVFPYEECHHVPMLMRWPSVVEPGSVCPEFVTTADFAPTFCEVAGAPALEGAVGRSLVPLLRGGGVEDWPQTCYGQFSGMAYYYTQRVVRDKRYKYVFNAFDYDELYDLEFDPHELSNLAQCAEYEPVKRRLIHELWDWVERTDDVICSTDYPVVAFVPYGPRDRTMEHNEEVGVCTDG